MRSASQAATAASQSAPVGACSRPARKAYVVSSGAIMPALAPHSMLMLQTVMRPSIDRRADRLAAVLDDVALPAAGADLGDEREHEVLGGDAGLQRALDGDGHRPRPHGGQRLGGEDVLDLAGADAEGQRAERAVGAGVAVAADDRHAGLGDAELRADDVDDALAGVAHGVQADAELARSWRAASRPACG